MTESIVPPVSPAMLRAFVLGTWFLGVATLESGRVHPQHPMTRISIFSRQP